jgi:hypothetical protein
MTYKSTIQEITTAIKRRYPVITSHCNNSNDAAKRKVEKGKEQWRKERNLD